MFFLGGGSIYRLLNKNIKEFNKVKLSIICVIFLLSVGFISYKINSSYALFSDSITGTQTIEATVKLKNLDTSGVNEPELDEGMIPVYYDESTETWRKASENNSNEEYRWYDYDNKMWANSVTVSSTNRTNYQLASVGTEIPMDDILTMQVWIPRYKYKVWNYNADGTKTSNEQEIQITFEKNKETTGEISCSDSISGTDGSASETCKLKSTNTTCTDTTCNNKTYTHPAFTFGDEEIKGFWIGKFELSNNSNCTATNFSSKGTGCNLNTITPLTKPELTSWRGAQISTFEEVIMKMNSTGNQYGIPTSADTHMIKNIEWGAVAYLSHSKYGTCTNGTCTEIGINNNSNYITGCGTKVGASSSTTCNKYNTNSGMLASTTSNIYGVYDMSGGSWEYVMGNMVYTDKSTMLSGFSLDRNSGYTGKVSYENSSNETTTWPNYSGINYPNTKYIDKYSYGSNIKKSTKLGEAIKEVQTGTNIGWYSDSNYSLERARPWFRRGGGHNGENTSGIFYSGYDYGSALDGASTRIIIIT